MIYKRMKCITTILQFVVCLFAITVISGCSSSPEKGIVDRINSLEKEGKLIVQKAELEIDPEYLPEYLELLREGISTSVAVEPGVLSLYAMADKDNPNKIMVFEVYASKEAYESHISSPHFLKYKNGTLEMVRSLILTRTTPVVFASKIK